jgi:hypothetical protein
MPFPYLAVGDIVRELFSGNSIGIEIIIEMNRIDIVTFHYIPDDIRQVSLHILIARVEIPGISIGQKPFRVYAGDMGRGNAGGSDLKDSPIGIAPGMEFHAPLMGLFDHELERIIIRSRRLALLSGKPLAPGFIGRRVEGIGSGPDLHHHGIHPVPFVHVQYPDEFQLLAIRIDNYPLLGQSILSTVAIQAARNSYLGCARSKPG